MIFKFKTWRGAAIVLLGVTLIVAMSWVLSQLRSPLQLINPFEAIPANVPFLLKLNDWANLDAKINGRTYAEDLNNLSFVQKIEQDILDFSPVFAAVEAVEPTWAKGAMLAAGEFADGQALEFLYVFESKVSSKKFQQIHEAFQQANFRQSIFNEYKIFEHRTDSTTFSVCLTRGLMLAAKSAFLVESAITQLENYQSNLLHNKNFHKINTLTGKNADVTMFVNLKNFPRLGAFLAEAAYQKDFEMLSQLGGWLGLDLTLQEENFDFNGYLTPNFQSSFWDALYSEKIPQKEAITRVIPDNTGFFMAFKFQSTENLIEKIEGTRSKEFDQFFKPWLGEEWAYVVTETQEKGFPQERFWVLETKDPTLTRKLLSDWAAEMGALPEVEHPPYRLRGVLAEGLLQPFFGNTFQPIRNPYYAILEDRFVVFANSSDRLKNWLDKFSFGQTLAEDVNYQQFRLNLSDASNLYLYINPSFLYHVFATYLQPDWKKTLDSDFKRLSKIKPVGFQLTPYNRQFLITGFAHFDQKGKQPTSVVWRSELKAEAAIAPQLVKNHNDNSTEILIQDTENRLYLFDRTGRQLWSKPLDGTIQSKIYQIDFYENGKLQYLFNTKNSLYLIDRNGDPVADYPRQFSELATNGVLVVDYDSTKDYRIFVACEDGNLYGFQKNGQPLSGWSPQEGVGRVEFPMQHFEVDERDFLVVLNKKGKIHFFKRNGEVRAPSVDIELDKGRSVAGFDFDISDPNAYRIVVVDDRAKAYIANFRGKKFNLTMKVGKNKSVKFVLSDVCGDERSDYILLSNKDLVVNYYDFRGDFRNVLEYEFQEPQDEIFEVEIPEKTKKYMATVARQTAKVYLFDENLAIHPDFPLGGSTRFVVAPLFDDGRNFVVVGNRNSLYTYKVSF